MSDEKRVFHIAGNYIENQTINVSGDMVVKEMTVGKSDIKTGAKPTEQEPAVEDKPENRGSKTKRVTFRTTTNEKEVERVQKYLGRHNLKSQKWEGKKENRMGITLWYFVHKWVKLGWIAADESMTALVRFFTEECDIQIDTTTIGNLANKMRDGLWENADIEIEIKVDEAFKDNSAPKN